MIPLLAIVWMYYNVKQLNKTVIYWLPFARLTLVFGSVGQLIYLALRKTDVSNETQPSL